MEVKIETQICQIVEDLFKRAGFNFESLDIEKNKKPEGQEIFVIKIESKDDSLLLIDDKGRNLKSFEYLAKLIASKKLNQKITLIIDLNDFLEKRNNKISELARLVARKVETTQKAYTLRPMSAYERRLIHLELAAWPNIITESIGEEPKRRVTIKPQS